MTGESSGDGKFPSRGPVPDSPEPAHGPADHVRCAGPCGALTRRHFGASEVVFCGKCSDSA